MNFLNFFASKNKNELNHDEKQSAQILKDIVYGYKQRDFDYIPNGIERLSIGLYYLSFKRSNKKVVKLEEAFNPLAILSDPKVLHYESIYSAINESIQAFCKDPKVLRADISLKEYEDTILKLLKYSAERINKI